ncbi:ABC transporter ATP-binding protein [Pleomorphomonas sp. JP5]|uniref:ABC transporter ATP-binding protein n=1 Tax=Pleomorphomonas sp. JP5 TaxID=2942998 RepID=UPI002043401D|nr:ABC transporter ATP-binding protein [Pleomorphomonas sp. JP5]MCM5559325.1 ABC transporter ATP-binding protein [Pleomorphomonas sp. JP5]
MTDRRDDGERAAGPAPVVAFDHISKTYANGTIALRDVSFSIPARTIHAICGENGAGKSTLMKILFGLEGPTSGQVLLDGQPVSTATRDFAGRHGIGMVHQHFSLIPTLSVTENIILGHEPKKGVLIDRAAARAKVEALSQRYGLAVDPDAITGRLPVAAQQKVEILKALSRDTRVLILDEPTAVLSPPEINELFNRLRDLRDHGITILFISHKLNEVRSLAESVTVLRAGQVAGAARLADVPDNMIMQMVMGRPVEITRREPRQVTGEPLLVMSGVSLASRDPADRLRDIDLVIHPGEIVGVAGVDGSGQRGLVSLVTGAARPGAGSIRFDGEDMAAASTARWRARGMAHLPSDRFTQGGVPALTLIENAIAGTDGDRRFQRGPFLRGGAISDAVAGMVEDYSVRALSIGERLDSLSGGNVQKLIAARELATKPRFLIADQPTRGIDVAAAAFIHKRIMGVAERGAAVLLVTADLDELLRLSDRVVVMFGGQITAALANEAHLTPERLGPFMLGLEGMP